MPLCVVKEFWLLHPGLSPPRGVGFLLYWSKYREKWFLKGSETKGMEK